MSRHEIGSDEWIAARIRKYKRDSKPKPRFFRVTWWQYVNLGGIGREDRGTFTTRKEAKAYVEARWGGMSAQDRRRWKIEPVL